MNLAFFISNRLSATGGKTFSRLIIRIAIASVSISLAVMIIAVAIVTGFQKEITDKVIGFGSHIQISALDLNNSFEVTPIKKNKSFLKELSGNTEIKHIQVFATKPGIIKTTDEIEGIILKGVDRDYDWNFFRDKMQQGTILTLSRDSVSSGILLSETTADRLKLKSGDPLIVYFIQKSIRPRKFIITGIFDTGLEEFDRMYALADIRQIQKLNDWDSTMVGGFELTLNDFNKINSSVEEIEAAIDYDLKAETIIEKNPQIFDWINLLDMNVIIIVVLMILVACINMITALLVLILERTNMIGILKSQGAEDNLIRKIFLYMSASLIFRGLMIGNIIGLGLCVVQQQYGLFKLDQQSYYMRFVPIDLDPVNVLLINAGTFALCVLIMLIPAQFVARITPLKAIRFN